MAGFQLSTNSQRPGDLFFTERLGVESVSISERTELMSHQSEWRKQAPVNEIAEAHFGHLAAFIFKSPAYF